MQFRTAIFGTLAILTAATGQARAEGRDGATGFLTPVTSSESPVDSMLAAVPRLSRTRAPKDTLDPVLMARWSLNYLAGSVSENSDYASSYGNWPLKSPPFAIGGDKIAIGDSEVRNALAFVLMREMSGSRFGAQAQAGVMDRILRYQLPCGLFNPQGHDDTDVLWATAWMSRALLEDFATTHNRGSLARAEKALRAVRQYAIEADGKGLLRLAPPAQLTLDGQTVRFAYRPTLDFCVLEPFVRCYEVTGDPEMLKTAVGLTEGRLRGYAQGHDTGHTHSHWHSLIGIAHLGAVTGEQKYLDWVENQIERWKPLMTDYGWFEATAGYTGSETCAVSDLMHVCAYLGRGGHAARYDLVERALRNYLPQEQFFIDESFLQLWRKQTYADPDRQMALVRRLEGGFLCRTTPSDRWLFDTTSSGPVSLEGCCPPTGMTALYLAWKDTVRRTDAGVWVNLACSRDAPEARVVSFLPGQGRVTVVPKRGDTFRIRVPAFVPRDQVMAWRNGRLCALPVSGNSNALPGSATGSAVPVSASQAGGVAWQGDYVVFPAARKGEELTVTYPVGSFVQKVNRAGRDYAFCWKGNALERIEPNNGVWPLFTTVPYRTPPFAPAKAVKLDATPARGTTRK